MNSFFSRISGRTFWYAAVSTFFLCAVASSAQVTQVIFLSRLINGVQQGEFENAVSLFLTICIILAVQIVFESIGKTHGFKYAALIMNTIRKKISDRICGMEYQKLEQFETGNILSVLTNDLDGVREWLLLFFQVGYIPFKFGMAIILCFTVSWQISLAAFFIAASATIIPMFLSNKLYTYHQQDKGNLGKINAHFSNTLRFLTTVKTYGLKELFSNDNQKALDKRIRVRQKIDNRNHFIQFFGTSVGHIGTAFMLLIGAYMILSGNILIGDMYTIILVASIAGEGIALLLNIPSAYKNARSCLDRVYPLLEQGQTRKASPKPVGALDLSSAAFSVKHVQFTYKNQLPALEDIAITIRHGEKIAVVGESGGGKTTFMKLLCGLYHADRGRIQLYGKDIDALTDHQVAQCISVMPQETFLFPGSIYDNFTIASPGAGKDEIEEVCKRVRIHEVIEALPSGYETNLTNINDMMSRGQLQRINLARALLSPAPVVLLDEPTSALDPELVSYMNQVIFDISLGRTLIMITHILSRPDLFDKVLFLRQGRVMGFASHNELMGTCDEYRRFLTEHEVAAQ